jgi:anti-anti-sigma factor
MLSEALQRDVDRALELGQVVPVSDVGEDPQASHLVHELWVALVQDRDHRTLQSVEHEGLGLILDLAGVTFTDSSGIHALARAAGRALERGRQLEIVNCPPSVERMLGLTGNQHLLRDSGVSELIGNSVGEWTPMALPQEGP